MRTNPDGSCLLQCVVTQIHQTSTKSFVEATARKFQAYMIAHFDKIYEHAEFPRKINIGPNQRDIQDQADLRKVVESADFNSLWLDHEEIQNLCTCLHINIQISK